MFALYSRLWRSWITQQIPILKIGGSNPFRRAKKEDIDRKVGVLFFDRRDSNPERVRGVKKQSGGLFLASKSAAAMPQG